MIVESMNDQEFALEVIRDFFDDMRDRDFAIRAMTKTERSSRGTRVIILQKGEINGF